VAEERDALQRRILALFVDELGDAVRVLTREVVRLPQAPPDAVRELFRVAHNLKGASHVAGVAVAGTIAHRLEDSFGSILDGSVPVDAELLSSLLADVDALDGVHRDLVGAAPPTATPPASSPSPEPDPSPGSPDGPPRFAAAPSAATARVSVDKLDSLVDRASDLVGVSARVAAVAGQVREHAAGTGAAEFAAAVARELARLSSEVANATVALTFRPFEEACDGLDRVVHDVASAAGKQARLEVRGGEVEVDRTVVAALREPLVHLVRNAVDHGLERPDERTASGKPAIGSVAIAAELRAGHLQVTVSDDGRGLDEQAVRTAAGPDGVADAAELVFEPGLSTAVSLSEVSGRGVGLDAVRTRLHTMGGTVRLRHARGEGADVVLVAPVTLALLRCLLVEAGEERVQIPVANVERLLRVPSDDLVDLGGSVAMLVDDQPVPVVPLAAAAGLSSDRTVPAGPLLAILVQVEPQRIAFVVDAVRDEADVVVKATPGRLAGSEVVLGTSTLPDGRAALVLNLIACGRRGLAAPGVIDSDRGGVDRPARILVVDDALTTRTLEVGILEAAGYEVLAAGDGLEAWAALDERGADLVVTDVHMPRSDGVELCRRIRSSERFSDLPVVMVTSLGSDEDRRAGLEAGADAYIVKTDLTGGTLLDAVERLL
jgi:two-component system chemotaxis sensor kinase CheA